MVASPARSGGSSNCRRPGVRLIISDACRGSIEAAAEVFPNTDWQRCTVHFYRNVFSHAPNNKVAEVARMLKAIRAQEDRAAAQAKATEVSARLKAMKLQRAADLVELKAIETLTYYGYPSDHWRQIRINSPLERIIREIHRRTRVVGAFPGGHSAPMLTAARLRHIASTKWGKRRYLSMDALLNPGKAGGRSLKFRPMATDSKTKARKNSRTTARR